VEPDRKPWCLQLRERGVLVRGTGGVRFWAVAIPIYWCCAFWFLGNKCPIFFDGSGPVPSFYWGRRPLSPTLAEWNENGAIRLMIYLPYLLTASVMTLLGCGPTTWLVQRWKSRHSPLFLFSSSVNLVLLLLLAAISDAGRALRFWDGPTVYASEQSMLAYLEIIVPISLLGGCLAIARDSLRAQQRDLRCASE
jgi:hypothetical protein